MAWGCVELGLHPLTGSVKEEPSEAKKMTTFHKKQNMGAKRDWEHTLSRGRNLRRVPLSQLSRGGAEKGFRADLTKPTRPHLTHATLMRVP